MDVFDRATEAEEQYRAQALADQAERAKTPAGDWRKLSAKWCRGIGCGERIPDARRQAVPGVEFCAQCQTEHEEQKRRTK